MKKAISLFLVFSVLLLSGNMFAKGRKGADLIINSADGYQVRGELIAVRQNSILLMERDSGRDVNIDVGKVRKIRVMKKADALWGGIIGFGTGAITATVCELTSHNGYGSVYLLFLPVGLLIGTLVGSLIGIDETIVIEGKSHSEIQDIQVKLRKKARVKNAL
jgi:hypothetical protein